MFYSLGYYFLKHNHEQSLFFICWTMLYIQIVPGNYYLSLVDRVTHFTIAAAVRLCFTFPSHLFDHAKAFELLPLWMPSWDPYGSYAGNNEQGRSNKRQNTSPQHHHLRLLLPTISIATSLPVRVHDHLPNLFRPTLTKPPSIS